MRPIKLRMTAFGPYAGTEIVDFREATDAGLFGIYGPTGAGKSSIFTAITFTLFGEAAKKEQPTSSLRSDHAPANLLTEAAFLFELAGKRYLVRREPDQARPKARGEGETSQPHAAWLFDVSDIDVDAVDMDGCGTVLAEKKVSQVADQIQNLLGYGAEQFRQIVLLPQGRFERFLTSNSGERLAILRELFDVSLYRSLTERLKEEAAKARRAVVQGFEVHGQRLRAEGFASSDELQSGIEERQAEAARLSAEASEKNRAHLLAQQEMSAAEGVEERFRECQQAQARLAELRAESENIEAQRQRRDHALLAQKAIDLHAEIGAAEHARSQAARQHENAIEAVSAASAELEAADAALKQEKARVSEVQEVRREIDRLESYRRALADADDLKDKHRSASQALANAEAAERRAATEQEEIVVRQEKAEASLAQARKDELQFTRLTSQRSVLAGKLNEAVAHDAAAEAVESATHRLNECEERHSEAESAFLKAQALADAAEAALLEAQANVLARHLVDGVPCPVCGAEEHPAPARGDADPQTLESDLEQARRSLSEAAELRQQTYGTRETARELLEERRRRLAQLNQPAETAETLREMVAAIDAELGGLGTPCDIEELELAFEELKEALKGARETAVEAAAALQSAKTDEAVAKRSYEDHIAGVPEQFRDGTTVLEAIEQRSALVEAHAEALVQGEERFAAATSASAGAQADLRNAKANADGADRAISAARERFAARLIEIELSQDQFAEYVEDVPVIQELDEQVITHDKAMHEAEVIASRAAAAVAAVERPDLDMLRSARDDAQLTANEAQKAAAAAEASHQQLLRLQKELADKLAELQTLEEETGPLRALAEACSGQNEMNTTLETFAIGAMFDQVLHAANLRLEPMTSGRYLLERDTETSGGRSKRGLDVLVHDIQTGRTRDLSTLSGGETFIAALSLALGLSDVVEATHGGIRLDTIFVDEGFGSLDTESDGGTLDLVLQVLQDIVGKRRTVGLISHVALVQQAVPNGFTVTKGFGGSTIEARAA